MQFEYSYSGSSSITNSGGETGLSFSPDIGREPTFFKGELAKGIEFREAMSSLHDIVVSDLRFKPKDHTQYLAWLAEQEDKDLAEALNCAPEVAKEMESTFREVNELRHQRMERMKPFYTAQQQYFNYLYKTNYDAWFVLDPVITVHPDEVFFECFSQDESTYGRLSTSYEIYENIGEFACGTTNIDYSQALYDEFQKIRSYKTTKFEIDPSGFEVQTSREESYKEVKIDLPDSWVRGFLQVSSAMSLPAVTFDLHPMDMHNLCFVLKRRKELAGPRGMRYVLTPGQPIKVVFEPWNIEVVCGRSIYQGPEATEVRVWGRRRIHVLERLIPIAKKFTVHLLGTGLPSFYVADLGDMSFTLGLSGWTANDWATAGNFDLMAPRTEVDSETIRNVFAGLRKAWFADPDKLAQSLSLDRATTLGALASLTQAGRAIFDLNKQVYRARELTREPLPMDRLRFDNPREASATALVTSGGVQCTAIARPNGVVELTGRVKDGKTTYSPIAFIDSDQRMIEGHCTCNFFMQNKFFKGPCVHLIAVRMGRENRHSFWHGNHQTTIN